MDEEVKKLELLPGQDETCMTAVFTDEDHTLGNALRYMLMKNSDVSFCGYSVPHPSEPKMNVRIQTRQGASSVEVLRRGLEDLTTIGEHIAGTFQSALEEFQVDAGVAPMDQ